MLEQNGTITLIAAYYSVSIWKICNICHVDMIAELDAG